MWIEQWNRVLRLRERVRVATQEYTPGYSTDDRRDDLLCFFQNCYHLKDWLLNDPATGPLVMTDIERFISSSTELSIVCDLANGSKHLDLSRGRYGPRTGDVATAVTRMDVEIVIGSGGRQTFYVSSKGVEYKAHELAEEAVGKWRQYLEQKALL